MFRISAHIQRNPRSGVFYFRLTVPETLRHIIGLREIKKSLRTGLRSEAVVLAQKYYYDTKVLFSIAEKKQTRMSDADKKAMDLDYFKANAQWDSDHGDLIAENEVGVGQDPVAVVHSGGSIAEVNLADFMSKITVPVILADGTKDVFIVEHENPVIKAEIARNLMGLTANISQPAQVKQPDTREENDVRLAEMIRDYLLEKKRAKSWGEKTYDDNENIFTLLKEVLRNPAVSTIGHKQANEFKNTLLSLPPNRTKGKFEGKSIKELLAMRPSEKMSVTSVNKYLRRVSGLFDWGKRHGYAFENPFSGIGISQSRQAHEERERFTLDDLKILFAPQNLNREKVKHSYYFWLPYLGLYTGARIEELCQLRLDDIRQESGLWVLSINDVDEKRVKTQSARRLVPIHPRLVELGFLEHVEAKRKRGADRLFPELKKQRDGYSQAASKWFARYREKHGVGKMFHSFRHTFIDELKQLDAEQKKIAALVGHKDESMTGGRYGKPYKPEVLHPVVCLLDFGV